MVQRPLLYLSDFFKTHQSEYYEKLQAVRDEGNWEGWLKFFLRGVAEVAKQASETARAIVRLREQHRELVRGNFERSTAKGLELLEHLFIAPIVTVNSVSDKTELSFANANKLVSKFVENGLLQETTGNRRNRVFTYSTYLSLF